MTKGWIEKGKLIGIRPSLLREDSRRYLEGILMIFKPSVSRYNIIKFMVSLAVRRMWKRRLMVVKNAFTNAPLKEELIVSQPKGFMEKIGESLVFRLKKVLYRLRQSPRE